MLVLRAFRDAGRVSAGSPPSHPQAERPCETGCGRTGGWARHSGFLLSFVFSFRAFRKAPSEKVRSLGAPREPSRAGGLGRGRRGGRSRWRRENREPVAVVGGGRAKRPGLGRRAFLPPARPVSLWSGKKASHKTANKKRLFVAQTSPFRKNWLYARYKEESRLGRPCGPKAQRRPPRSALGATSPRGSAISESPWLETAAPFRVKVRQIRGPGYPAPKT